MRLLFGILVDKISAPDGIAVNENGICVHECILILRPLCLRLPSLFDCVFVCIVYVCVTHTHTHAHVDGKVKKACVPWCVAAPTIGIHVQGILF